MGQMDNRIVVLRARVLLLAISAACVAVLMTSEPGWAGSGGCISLEVASPMRLPDGTVHPAGGLTLCDSTPISPVATLHKTYVNGQPVAMLQSRKTTSEGGAEISPVVLFFKDKDGNLELYGYVLPARGRSVTYLLNEKRELTRRNSDVAASLKASTPVTVVAARTQ